MSPKRATRPPPAAGFGPDARVAFREHYGPWAVVAGASEGLGAAFSRALARRGVDLLLIARRKAPLLELAEQLAAEAPIRVRTLPYDLAQPGLRTVLAAATAGLEVGLGVYNAAFAPVESFVEQPLTDIHRTVDVNVRAPLTFVHTLAPPMVRRGHGGLVLMSSLSGFQGSPRIATYAGTKAFNHVFAEGLWYELRSHGVDVSVCCAGAIRTPAYLRSTKTEAPGALDPEDVAERALTSLGAGPVVVPGFLNRLVSLLVGRWMPRRAAIRIMASNTKGLS